MNVLKKPIITEKSNQHSEKLNRFTFEVDKRANKKDIKKAVEELFDVEVERINTSIRPAKTKRRYTKKGIIEGKKPAQKRAVIFLKEGHTINYYENI
ncbi:MAG: 50S ribosomal protein L23 [Chitinophagales bacterium]|nr:50S ribosomal protein L23 [Bacteroidota bacterium]MCB9042845.1 50S ribosomal protein L23 [Chitinophagales bacterium]